MPEGKAMLTFETDIAAVPDLLIDLQFRKCERGEMVADGLCVVCPSGFYSLEYDTVTECSACPDHATCFGDSIVVDKGYWRLSDDTVTVFTCPLEGSCVGGLSTGVDMCSQGYTGILCGVCDVDYYYPSLSATCEACSGQDLQIGLLIVVCFAGVVAVGLFVCTCGGRICAEFSSQTGLSYLSMRWKASHQSFLKKKAEFLKSENTARKYQNKLKQLITLFQILTAFPSILSTTFPNIYYQLTSAFNVFNVGNILTDLGLVCSFEFDYISTVILATMLPVFFSLALYTIQRIHCYYVLNQYSPVFREAANVFSRIDVLKSTYLYVFLFFTYLILPGVSTVLFGMLKPCTDVDPDNVNEGQSYLYLEADLSIHCEGSRYNFGVAWAAVGCFIYPFGIPCLYFYMLYNSKDLIQKRAKINVSNLDQQGLDKLEQMGMNLSSLKFLFQEYQPKFWYFEIIETFRKLFLTSVLSVISPGSTKQLVFGNLFVVLCLILYVCISPFDDLELTVTSAICQLQIWFILFLGILIKENVHISSTFIEISVAFAILFVLVYEAFWCVIEFCPLPAPVEAFFDRVIISKSLPPPAPATATKGGGMKSNAQSHGENANMDIEEAIDKVVKLLSENMDNDVDGLATMSMTMTRRNKQSLEAKGQLVEKLQQVLKSHQSIISDQVMSLEGVDVEKGFVNKSVSFALDEEEEEEEMQKQEWTEEDEPQEEEAYGSEEGGVVVKAVELVGL
jgi:hypothetical protein